MIKKLCVLYLILLIPLFSQTNERIVAKVGDCIIYESEFKERFDFSAHPKLLSTSDKQKAKHEFLEQLIAEKLLSLEAKSKGYDTNKVFKDIVTPLENMFVRDAFYSKEIKSKMYYSPADISEGLSRIKNILKLKFIHSKDLKDIDLIYKQLKSGASFDSILSLRPEVRAQASPREVTFGTMEKEIEDSIYILSPGKFTSPIKSEDGYYILTLISIEPNHSLKDRDMVNEDVKRIVEKRAEYKRYLEFYRGFFKDYRITADKDVFEELVKEFISAFAEKYVSPEMLPDTTKFILRGVEVTSALINMSPTAKNKTFIVVGNKEILADYFLNQLSHTGFIVQYPRELSIRASLSSYIRKFIEDELLTIEANKHGLNKSADVTKYMSMWNDAYLSQRLMLDIFDSTKISDEEAFLFYSRNKGNSIPFEWVNIAEVLIDSLHVVETVLNELANGKSIKNLARQYTKRDSLKDKGGEFGFFPATMHGELGKNAAKLEPGQIFGPIKLDEGYSIFQVLDKKVAPLEIPFGNADTADLKTAFEEMKDQIVMQLTLNNFEKHVNEYNAALAKKYGVEINENVLNSIDNTFLNLVVVRYMGFGGEIFAVPYTEQFSGWYKIWAKDNDLTP